MIDGLHRTVSLLAVAVVGVHVLTTVADGFTPIGLKDAVIPFASPYRRLWLGLGTLAFDLLLAVTLTSVLRRRLGHRAWRAVHWTAYACWPLALIHGLGTGTDTPVPWMLLLSAACLPRVLVAVGWRVAAAWPEDSGRRTLAGAVRGGRVAGARLWVAAGPAGTELGQPGGDAGGAPGERRGGSRRPAPRTATRRRPRCRSRSRLASPGRCTSALHRARGSR